MDSFMNTLMTAIVGKGRSDLHRERMTEKTFVGLVEIQIQPRCRQETRIGISESAIRPSSSSHRGKAPSTRSLPPPLAVSPNSRPLSPFGPQKCPILFKNKSTRPKKPSVSFLLPAPTYIPFPLPSDQIIGYGRYRQWRFAPKEDILAHIDAQIADISSLLIHCNMLDCKIPGYDDITFGDRLRATSEREMEQARVTLAPSLEKSPNGTTIYHGFLDAERIIMRAAARSSLSLLLADELSHLSEEKCDSSNPMARSDKGSSQAWEKTGFTKHPLPKHKTVVRRKWNELEKLKPKWGPAVARREEAERYRQEKRAAAYVGANGNAAGCFRVEGRASTGCRVKIGGKNVLGQRIDPSQIARPKDGENDNDDRAKALRDIENAIASDSECDSESDCESDCESNCENAIEDENAIESDSNSGSENESEVESDLEHPSNIPIKRKKSFGSLSARTDYSSRRSKKPDDIHTNTASKIKISSGLSSRCGAEAKAGDRDESTILANRRVVRFCV